MRHFLGFQYLQEARLVPSLAADIAGDGLGVKKRLQTKPVVRRMEGGQN